MYRKAVLAAAILFFSAQYACAAQTNDTYKDAQRYLDSGDYPKAEDAAKKLVSAEPKNARYHQLLADAYRKEGKPREALSEYEAAKRLGADNAELHKGMSMTHKWLRDYNAAENDLRKALVLNPNDTEAKEDLKALQAKRGLRVKAMIGGWEADYTKTAYEGAVSYGGFDKLDLTVGAGYADQTFYKRTKVYANGYYFYTPDSYFKAHAQYKKYTYPVDSALKRPNPDSNSYDKVPAVEFEISHWFTPSFRGTAAYEFFRPNFFYDKDSYANNHKLSAEAYYITPFQYLRLKAMYAILRDPDPAKTTIKGRTTNVPGATAATSTSVKYETQSLLGGGVEYKRDKWNAELKYLPNRDLDSSYAYSVMAGIGYDFTDRTSGRFDYTHDKYSSHSTYSGKTADVYLASVFYKLNPQVDLGVGLKHMALPVKNENTGFLTATYRTGLVF